MHSDENVPLGNCWDGDLVNAKITGAVKDDGLVLNTVHVEVSVGLEQAIVLEAFRRVDVGGTRLSLAEASGMSFVDSLL